MKTSKHQIERGNASGHDILARSATVLGGRLHQAIYSTTATSPPSREPPVNGVLAALTEERNLPRGVLGNDDDVLAVFRETGWEIDSD